MPPRRNPAFAAEMFAKVVTPESAAVPAPKVERAADPPKVEKVQETAPEPRPQGQPPRAPTPPPIAAPPRAPRLRGSAFRPASRVGKRALTVWLDPAAKRQFDQICLNEDKNGEELLREFLNDAFDRRGFSRIA